ncbi:NAD(P)-binding protein [Periconia macrospinosa]|uniref:NAD(P)-binding protein n=1 Tax=Periconia macrospinosa TaxID=97972 RepID=A0A2V1DHF7_9PLEO|nr:NAD(P)-binding protein [Periconia macrospinosa]
MASKTIVLITGSNRGIGLGLLERYLAKPSHIVIAAVRNPAHPTAQALQNLPKGPDTQLIVVKIDASIEKDAHDAVAELQQKHGIDHLDIVIANAGVAYIYPTVADVKIEDIKAHMEPNVYGTIALYQATRDLLKKSAREPIFFIMGSSAGLLKNHLPIPNAAYAPTKTVLNWYTRRIDAENDWLNCFTIDPGHVSTDLGDAAAVAVGIGEHAPTSVQESCDGMMNILDKATKKEYGGKLAVFTGGFHEW